MRISTVLFDLDGTLTDSGPGIMNSVKYALEKVGEPTPDVDELRKFIGPPLKGQFMDHCGIDEEKAAEMVTLYREYFTVTGIFENSVYDGVEEMLELIHSGAGNIVCTQPFACLPNHVVGKGVIKELRRRHPESNIVAIDFDPGASEVNQLNRIKLMLSTAFKNLEK